MSYSGCALALTVKLSRPRNHTFGSNPGLQLATTSQGFTVPYLSLSETDPVARGDFGSAPMTNERVFTVGFRPDCAASHVRRAWLRQLPQSSRQADEWKAASLRSAALVSVV